MVMRKKHTHLTVIPSSEHVTIAPGCLEIIVTGFRMVRPDLVGIFGNSNSKVLASGKQFRTVCILPPPKRSVYLSRVNSVPDIFSIIVAHLSSGIPGQKQSVHFELFVQFAH